MAIALCFVINVIHGGLAAASDWFGYDPVVTVDDANFIEPTCNTEKIRVVSPFAYSQYLVESACVTHGASADFARYSVVYAPGDSYRYRYGIKMAGDSLYRHLEFESVGGGISQPRIMKGTNRYVFTYTFGGEGTALATVEDVNTDFEAGKVAQDGTIVGLRAKPDKITFWSPGNGSSAIFSLDSFSISNDMKTIVSYYSSAGYLKADLAANESVLLTETVFGNLEAEGRDMVHAVSDDGKYALVGMPVKLLSLDQCGKTVSTRSPLLRARCESVEIQSALQSAIGYNFSVDDAHFIEDDTAIEFRAIEDPISPSPKIKHVKISLGKKRNATVTYLALGDSYTSGEGDRGKQIDGSSYYTIDTRVTHQCHQSIRSYPYLLRRDYWRIPENNMHSVACSGALVNPDYLSPLESYRGQHDELIHDIDASSRQTFIDSTLDNYVPGRVPQIEFVKKYQPDVITLTGGGNDVGFADIIKYCAGDVAETFVAAYSCEYVEGGALHQTLNDTLDSQYKTSRELIEKIKTASPKSKIFYVGYPSFVKESGGDCALNTGTLDSKEREMINDAITRLNGVIRQVTADTGVEYVDIQDVLKGGRLCEGSEYVNGVWDVGLIDVAMGGGSEAFHPNAKAHELIAQAIANVVKDPMSDYRPEAPRAVVVKPVTTTRQQRMADDAALEGEVLRVQLQPSTFAGSSDIIVVGYSTPTQLGTYRSRSDGSIDVTIRLPEAMKAGVHVLTLLGTGHDGNALRLFQYLTIVKNDTQPVGAPDDRARHESSDGAIPANLSLKSGVAGDERISMVGSAKDDKVVNGLTGQNPELYDDTPLRPRTTNDFDGSSLYPIAGILGLIISVVGVICTIQNRSKRKKTS